MAGRSSSPIFRFPLPRRSPDARSDRHARARSEQGTGASSYHLRRAATWVRGGDRHPTPWQDRGESSISCCSVMIRQIKVSIPVRRSHAHSSAGPRVTASDGPQRDRASPHVPVTKVIEAKTLPRSAWAHAYPELTLNAPLSGRKQLRDKDPGREVRQLGRSAGAIEADRAHQPSAQPPGPLIRGCGTRSRTPSPWRPGRAASSDPGRRDRCLSRR